MTLCTGCTGTGISLLRGSTGGKGRLFSGTARGASGYTTRGLPAARRPNTYLIYKIIVDLAIVCT